MRWACLLVVEIDGSRGAAFFNHSDKEVVIPKTNDNLYELSIRRKATPEVIISTGK